MRIRLIFNVKNPGAVIPFHHQYILSDFFRYLIRKEEAFYNNFDLYNFSAIKGKLQVAKEGLQLLSNKATIVFSTPDENFLKLFLKSLFKEKFVAVGEVFLETVEVEQEQQIISDESELKYVCLSPIVLLNPKNSNDDPTRFIDPSSDEFSDLLYESTMDRLEQIGKFSEEELGDFYKFQLIPDKYFISRLKVGDKKFSRIYNVYDNHQKYEVRGYTIPFTMYASSRIQKFIFNCGLGEFTGNGLGMVDLAEKKFSARTTRYSIE